MRPYLFFSAETAFTSNAARKSDIPSLPILPLCHDTETLSSDSNFFCQGLDMGYHHRSLFAQQKASRWISESFLHVASCFSLLLLGNGTTNSQAVLNCAYSFKICARGSSEENARRAILANFHHIVCFSSTVFWTNCHSVVIFCPRHCESAPGQAAAV